MNWFENFSAKKKIEPQHIHLVFEINIYQNIESVSIKPNKKEAELETFWNKKCRVVLLDKMEGYMQQYRHLKQNKKINLKLDMRQSCSQPFNEKNVLIGIL